MKCEYLSLFLCPHPSPSTNSQLIVPAPFIKINVFLLTYNITFNVLQIFISTLVCFLTLYYIFPIFLYTFMPTHYCFNYYRFIKCFNKQMGNFFILLAFTMFSSLFWHIYLSIYTLESFYNERKTTFQFQQEVY